MKRRKINLIIGVIFVLIFSFSNFSFAQQSDVTVQQIVEFVNKTNNILKNMNENVNEKSKLVQQVLDSGAVKESYQIETEITVVIAEYKKQIESLSAPSKCEELKAIIIKLMDLLEQMHSALSKGDIDKYKLLAPQVTDYSSKMQKEIQSLQAYYTN